MILITSAKIRITKYCVDSRYLSAPKITYIKSAKTDKTMATKKVNKKKMACNKPKRTPSHPKKSHVVKACAKGKQKIIRFGEQLKTLKDNNPETYKEMVARMERVRELRNSVLRDFNPEDLVGIKFKDTDGNLYSYDLEQLTAMKDQFTIFLDEFINSGTLKAVRTGLQDNVANLNAFGRLNKKIILGDIDRYLKIEEDRNEFLAMQLKRLLPIFQQSNEGASQTIKKFQDIITKEKRASMQKHTCPFF